MKPWLLCFCVLGAGCGGPGHNLSALPNPTVGTYRLEAGDQIRVITFGEERLTGEFRVNDAGLIAVPLLGNLQAAGMTTQEMEASLGAALAKGGLIRKPSVSVEIIAYRPVYVLGEVNKPGQYPYVPGMTVVTAVAVAGGFTYRGVQDYAAIVRSVDGQPMEGKVLRQNYIQPGDVITVFERRF